MSVLFLAGSWRSQPNIWRPESVRFWNVSWGKVSDFDIIFCQLRNPRFAFGGTLETKEIFQIEVRRSCLWTLSLSVVGVFLKNFSVKESEWMYFAWAVNLLWILILPFFVIDFPTVNSKLNWSLGELALPPFQKLTVQHSSWVSWQSPSPLLSDQKLKEWFKVRRSSGSVFLLRIVLWYGWSFSLFLKIQIKSSPYKCLDSFSLSPWKSSKCLSRLPGKFHDFHFLSCTLCWQNALQFLLLWPCHLHMGKLCKGGGGGWS